VYRSFLAVRYIKSRFVNLISVGGVMVGVAVLIVVTAVMDGFQARVKVVLRGNLSHLRVAPTSERVPDLAAFSAELREHDDRIVGVAPLVTAPLGYFLSANQHGGLRFGDRTIHVMTAVGLDWELEQRIQAERVKRSGPSALEGGFRIVAANDLADPFKSPFAEKFEYTPVLVSRAFARGFLGVRRDEDLGRWLENRLQVELLVPTLDAAGQMTNARHLGKNLIISGFYDGGDQSEDRSRLLFRRADLVTMAELREPWQELRVWLEDYDAARAVQLSLVGRWPDLVVETWEDQRADFLRAVHTEKVLLVIVLSFIVLLGGFIILATLTLTVVEKTRDIGILAALGASRGGILSIFLRNGLLIGVVGAALGVGLGALLVANLDGIKSWFDDRGVHLFPPDIYLFTEVPTVWSWPTVAVIALGSVAIAFFAGLLPALRAARLDPVVALRHE
jgi:lipoprotein-releasing system permease protein